MLAGMPPDPELAAVRAWLDTAPDAERSGAYAGFSPARMRALLAHLPAPPAPCTVAGTKGKGSTAALIEAALAAGGHATIGFASPHVASLAERWRIDGRPASGAALAPLVARAAAAEASAGVAASWFERAFALAVLLAADRPGCAFVCEVGLGGRLDATNALDPAVAVITHLSHDHREVLGPTLWHIAGEKLGIARTGAPLVIAPQSAEAALALLHRLPPGAAVRWASRPERPFALALAGDHQQDNAAAALLAATLYRPGLDPERARAGMAACTLPGRCQLVAAGGRRLLIDGAHNGPSLAATLAVASARLRPGWTLVLGTARDKELGEMLAVIPPGVAVRRCGYASPRGRGAADWPAEARAWPWHAEVAGALAACPGDACVSGSLYLAGEALAALG